LGSADLSVIQAVLSTLAGDHRPVSVALGELTEPYFCPSRLPWKVAFAKFGLSGCGGRARWARLWRDRMRLLPEGVQPVAVAYVDWRPARAPEPEEVLDAALAAGCAGVLLDTYAKDRGDLFAHLADHRIARIVRALHRAGLLAVLGGSLHLKSLPRARQLAPDFVAVRGAACVGGRAGRVHHDRVRMLAQVLAADRDRESLAERPQRVSKFLTSAAEPPILSPNGEQSGD
jgi:hypothetical protein